MQIDQSQRRRRVPVLRIKQHQGGRAACPKDMQDYFASTAQTNDWRVLMSLMRHTNLTTTTKYLRARQERMKEAVQNLGATQNKLRRQKRTNSIQAKMAELARMLIAEQNVYRKVGGGGRSRTYDAADMSREDWDESY